MLDFLPLETIKLLNKIGLENISEIRIRDSLPVSVCVNGIFQKLLFRGKYITFNSDEIENIVLKAVEYSVYSYDEYIRKGFITTKNGERIGLSGEFVYDKEKLLTIKNFSSLCIRVPHDVKGVTDNFFKYFYTGKSLLVFSETGVGKTTFLRDLCRNISKGNEKNIVVIDERNEICVKNGTNGFYLGDNVDVLTFCTKIYGFTQALRTLNPSYVICDELISEDDVNGVIRAVNGGINVIASVHAYDMESIKSKFFLKKLINEKIFNQYICLKIVDGERKQIIYDGEMRKCL